MTAPKSSNCYGCRNLPQAPSTESKNMQLPPLRPLTRPSGCPPARLASLPAPETGGSPPGAIPMPQPSVPHSPPGVLCSGQHAKSAPPPPRIPPRLLGNAGKKKKQLGANRQLGSQAVWTRKARNLRQADVREWLGFAKLRLQSPVSGQTRQERSRATNQMGGNATRPRTAKDPSEE